MTTLSVLILTLGAIWLVGKLEAAAIAVDQVFNVLIGSGYADETLSAFAHRKGGWRRATINALFFWQVDHCQESYFSEMNRRHLPPEYRT